MNDLIQKDNVIGKFKGHDIFLKSGKYGYYIECNEQKETLKNIDHSKLNLEQAIELIIAKAAKPPRFKKKTAPKTSKKSKKKK